jgi:hypothetical protein
MPGSQSYRTSVYSPGKWKGEQITLSCDVQPARAPSVRLGGAVANHLGQTIK